MFATVSDFPVTSLFQLPQAKRWQNLKQNPDSFYLTLSSIGGRKCGFKCDAFILSSKWEFVSNGLKIFRSSFVLGSKKTYNAEYQLLH